MSSLTQDASELPYIGISQAGYSWHICCELFTRLLQIGGTLRSRPFHSRRTLSDERSPRGSLTSFFGPRHDRVAGTNSPRYCRPDLPSGTDSSVLLKRRSEEMLVQSTSQLPLLPHHIQEVPPEFLSRTLYLFPSVNSVPMISEGTRWLRYSLLVSKVFSTFQWDFSQHANSPSPSYPAPFSLRTSHRNHRSTPDRMNAAPEIEHTGSVTEGYSWRLL